MYRLYILAEKNVAGIAAFANELLNTGWRTSSSDTENEHGHHFRILTSAQEDLESSYPELKKRAEEHSVDAILMPKSFYDNGPGFAAFDMDSTLITCECIDQLAAMCGAGEQVSAVTAAAMRGELEFNESFNQRVGCLKGLSMERFNKFANNLPLMPGAQELLDALNNANWYSAVFSGGFSVCAEALAKRIGLKESLANELDHDGKELNGGYVGRIVNGDVKLERFREVAIEQKASKTIAVGDGANDLPMLAAADHGFALHAKPLVREKAKHCLNFSNLEAIALIANL